MAIEVHCDCKNVYAVGPELSGKKIRCKSCGVVLKVPIVPIEQSGEAPPPSDEYEVVKDSKAQKGGAKGAAGAPVVCKTCGAPGKPGDAVCLACGAELGAGGPGLVEKIPKPVLFGVLGLIVAGVLGFAGFKIWKSVHLGGLIATGRERLDAKQWGAAKASFGEALKADPESVDALEGLVQTGMAEPDWKLVKARGPALALKSPPGRVRAGVKRDLARAFLESGEFPNAIKYATEARQEDSSIESVDELEGLGHLGAKENEKALELLKRADSAGSTNPKVQTGLAKLAEATSVHEARIWAEKAVQNAGKDASIWLECARLREADNDKSGSVGAYERAREADPKSVTAHVKLALAYLDASPKRASEALAEAKAAKELKADDPEVAKALGMALLESKDWDGAKKELAQAEKASSEDWSVVFLYGRALILTGDVAGGCDKLEKALKKRDKDLAAWLEAGRLLFLESNKPERAIPFLEAAIRIEPRLPGENEPPAARKPLAEARLFLARAIGKADREKNGPRIESLLKEAIQIDESREEISVELAEHFLALNKPADALAALEPGLAKNPKAPRLLLEAGNAANRAKQWDTAISHLTTLLEIDSNNKEAKEALERAKYGKSTSGD